MLLKGTGGEVRTFCFSEAKKTLPVSQETKYRSRIFVVDDDDDVSWKKGENTSHLPLVKEQENISSQGPR